jgi:hypothetical protein
MSEVTEVDSELEGWKLSVSRSSSYIQSNASFEIFLFGFYASAVAITFGTASNDNAPLMRIIVIPIFTCFVLYASCYYFNRLTTQHVYIRLFGLSHDKNAHYKSSDALWDDFKKLPEVSVMGAIHHLGAYRNHYTGPYPAFFILYVVSGASSFSYGIYHSISPKNAIFIILVWILCLLIWLSIVCLLLLYIALLTERAWRAIEYAANYKQNNSAESAIPPLPPTADSPKSTPYLS